MMTMFFPGKGRRPREIEVGAVYGRRPIGRNPRLFFLSAVVRASGSNVPARGDPSAPLRYDDLPSLQTDGPHVGGASLGEVVVFRKDRRARTTNAVGWEAVGEQASVGAPVGASANS